MMMPGDDGEAEAEADKNDEEHRSATVLPSPFASAISLVTATSSLSLKVGGFISNAFINGAKVSTLTAFELGRSVLEDILSRAGRDVTAVSSRSIGRSVAESLLDRALLTLHDSITKTSFLISTGFQIGSTSVSASIGLAQYFLSALDAVFGDTETSRAIATIIVLVRREFRNPETGMHGEQVGLSDVIVGAIGFALLQSWGRQRTDDELKDKDVEEVVWSIVVGDDQLPSVEQPISFFDAEDVNSCSRRGSCLATKDREQLPDVPSADDDASMVSATTRPLSLGNSGTSQPELAFKQHLMDQLTPDTRVRVTAQSVITNTVSVSIFGDSTAHIEPPEGYSLIAAHHDKSVEGPSQTQVFHNRRKRVRRGSFEIVEDRNVSEVDAVQEVVHSSSDEERSRGSSSNTLNAEALAALEALAPATPTSSGRPQPATEPNKANQKRARSPIATRDSRIPVISPSRETQRNETIRTKRQNPQAGHASPKKSAIRQTLSAGTSYQNLVEFWSQHGPHKTKIPQPLLPTRSRSKLPAPESMQINSQTRSSLEVPKRPSNHSLHRRASSSAWSIASAVSETSMVLRRGIEQIDDISTTLRQAGCLRGQFPHESFAHNAARFARFSAASYGARFLRFTGALRDKAESIPNFADLAEHSSFASYSRLPPSTVLVSSYVDPEGGTDASGETDTGMPLTHYISLDHESKAVVLTCRGRLGFEDVLTAATCDYDDFIWGGKVYQVHKGSYASARRLLSLHRNRVTATIKAALEEFKDYGLVLCGHSLGGGVAAIVGIMLSHKANDSSYITGPFVNTPTLCNTQPSKHAASRMALTLPAGRPIHVYAYGPAATVSPALQRATRGLITTIVNRQDSIPYFSLGTLRDFQAIAMAFKTDTKDAKGEVKKRVWEGLRSSIRDRSGLAAFSSVMAHEWLPDDEEEDHWPWAALKSLRAGMNAEKLVPPGEVFLIESRPVLQRYAFTSKDDRKSSPSDVNSSKPATHVKLTHIKDVAIRFGELRFGSSMYADHLPSRYEKALEALERGMIG